MLHDPAFAAYQAKAAINIIISHKKTQKAHITDDIQIHTAVSLVSGESVVINPDFTQAAQISFGSSRTSNPFFWMYPNI